MAGRLPTPRHRGRAEEGCAVKKLTNHTAADIFPMMTADELAELAADIKANGLAIPVVIDSKAGLLIDGRNRLAACNLAGVEPRFEELGDRDPLAFIASANLNRRNLTKGQQAMLLAMIYPEPEKGGRGRKSAAINCAETSQFSRRRLEQARSVLAFSRPMAEDVVSGVRKLDAALGEVEAARSQSEGEHARLDRLRSGAPDLADLVAEERMTLGEATAAWTQRESERRAAYQSGVNAVARLLDFAGYVTAIETGEAARSSADPPIVVKHEHLDIIRRALVLLEKFERSDR
jgi:hypothetical protein